ncbi:MAG: hypothetical protein JSV91_06605 [Phycisphaerales bacterium]|nr:MAG: hypothetical protein JSV91_06605 [Phycisphaerales bacterium]
MAIGIAVCFLALAGWFLFGPASASFPRTESAVIAASDITIDPVRTVQTDQPVVKIAGFEMHCMNCHGLFESRPETARRLTQHQHIVLDHGLNDRCFNCHDNEQRDMLALRGSKKIPYKQVARLCAKCHGPTYRDWQQGMHGKALLRWDPDDPGRRPLRCSECHDPHAPAFDPLRPLPGPNTLRMGDPKDKQHGGEVDLKDPLRKWQLEIDNRHLPAEPGPSEGIDEGTAASAAEAIR